MEIPHNIIPAFEARKSKRKFVGVGETKIVVRNLKLDFMYLLMRNILEC